MRLSARAVREFCLLTLRELDGAGLDAARAELETVASTAHLVRQGRPRYRLLVADGVVVSVLGESSRGKRRA